MIATAEQLPTEGEQRIIFALLNMGTVEELVVLSYSEADFLENLAFSVWDGWRDKLARVTRQHHERLPPEIRVIAALKGWT